MRAGSRALIAIAVAMMVSRGAYADDPPPLSGQLAQDTFAIDLGFIASVGQSEYAFQNGGTTPNVSGVVIRDHNGWTGRAVVALVLAILGSVGASGDQHLEHTYIQVDRTSQPGYEITTTTTVDHVIHLPSRAELDEKESSLMDGLFGLRHADFELDLYSRNVFGFGDADGYKLNAMVGAGETTEVELGFGVGTVRSYVRDDAGMRARINYSYAGMPIRVSRVVGPVRLAATYEWNVLSTFGGGSDTFSPDREGMSAAHSVSSPFHVDASSVVFGRVAVSAGIVAQRLWHPGTLGVTASVGLVF